MGIRVAGVGGYVPSKTMTNYELAMMVDTSDEWITKKTGIRERRIAAPEEAPSDMACQAALRCLTQAGVDKAAVDLVIVACATPDQSQPAVACMVQEKLGIAEGQCPAFDVNSVCAGFVFALNVAQGMMLTDAARYRNVLVIGTDTFSKILNWKDRTHLRVLRRRGGGGAAVAVRRRRAALSFSPGQRRPWARVHRGARRRHPPAGQPRGDREAPEQVRHERPPGLGVRRQHRSRDDPFAARRTRPRPRRSGPADLAPEQPADAGGDHGDAGSCRWRRRSPPSRATATRRPPAFR